ncbi:MAG: methylenetetrahydrofolate reductase C-terminal domain-containing protein [Planctomycetota bacterium]
MLTTTFKSVDELSSTLPERVFVIHCNGCAEVGFSLEEAREVTDRLREQLQVVGEEVADYLCRPDFTEQRLELYRSDLKEADAVLVFSCGVGVQTVADLADVPVYTGGNTVKLPGCAGLRPTDLECDRCGDCVIGYTAGICPIANCSKGLVNGQCGGAQDGKCEVDESKDCAWVQIYERLRDRGRLDMVDNIAPFRDYSKYEAPVAEDDA